MSESTADSPDTWPPIIEKFPEADLQIDGLFGRILKCSDYWVLFMVADRDVTMPVHHHGAQWGVVLAGSMELTIGDSRVTYRRGDAHYIPPDVDHGALLHAGWQGLYVFKRRNLE